MKANECSRMQCLALSVTMVERPHLKHLLHSNWIFSYNLFVASDLSNKKKNSTLTSSQSIKLCSGPEKIGYGHLI